MKILKNQKGFGLVEGLLVVIALTLLAGVGYYVYDRQNSKNQAPQTAKTVTEENTQETPPVETLPELVEYGDEGIKIAKKADVEQLYDASDSFKNFMASQVGEDDPADGDCEAYTFQVFTIIEDEFASGGSGSPCGGGAGVIWKKQAGTWQSVLGYQDIPQCKEVDKYGIPGSMIENCIVEDSASPGGFREVKNTN